VDTGDAALDQSLSGFIRVVTGYEDAVLCPVRC
jgi:predicted polyphosphate/ATP-dependent NAD kinase